MQYTVYVYVYVAKASLPVGTHIMQCMYSVHGYCSYSLPVDTHTHYAMYMYMYVYVAIQLAFNLVGTHYAMYVAIAASLPVDIHTPCNV